MTAFQLQHNRPDCIACGVCAMQAPEFWKMDYDGDGKSDIHPDKKPLTRGDGWELLDMDEAGREANKEAAECCPVNVIHIVNKETGEKLI